jgi:Glycosyltransferase family 92
VPRANDTYLSVCSIYRDHSEYLREWIEFHRLMGADRLILYDNESSDDHLEVLAPYLEDGTVVLHSWPTPPGIWWGVPWGIKDAFNDCLQKHREDSRWIAFIDIDEFLFCTEGQRLPDVLVDYERFPGVCVSRAEFGMSGHRHRQPGLVIENYLHRKSYPDGATGPFKSIVDPTRAKDAFNAHRFHYLEGDAVDENQQPAERPLKVQLSRLRINHYTTKSEQEYREKIAVWKERGFFDEEVPALRRMGLVEMDEPIVTPTFDYLDGLTPEFDDTITRWVPDLREALKRTDERQQQGGRASA